MISRSKASSAPVTAIGTTTRLTSTPTVKWSQNSGERNQLGIMAFAFNRARAKLLGQRSRLDPVDEELALGEEPTFVALGECVEIANGGDHQAALAVDDRDVMRETIADAGG